MRDIERVYGERIVIMVHEDNPEFPQLNPDEGEWDRYNDLGAVELADDIEAQARGLADILDTLRPEDWSRTMVRDGGRDGVFEFTVVGLANYAVHESHHHLLDANGTLKAATS